MNHLQAYSFVQIFTMLLAIFGVVEIILWSRRKENVKSWWVTMPLLAAFVHMIIFYSFGLYAQLTGETLSSFMGIPVLSTNWSAVLRLQETLTLLCYLPISVRWIKTYGTH